MSHSANDRASHKCKGSCCSYCWCHIIINECMNIRMNVLQITSALAAVRSKVWFHTNAFLIPFPCICCLDSAQNQFLSSDGCLLGRLPGLGCWWSGCALLTPRIVEPGVSSHHPVLSLGPPRTCLCWPARAVLLICTFTRLHTSLLPKYGPALPYFSVSLFRAAISSVTLGKHWPLMTKWPSMRATCPKPGCPQSKLPSSPSPSESSMYHQLPSPCHQTHVRCKGYSSSGGKKTLQSCGLSESPIFFFPMLRSLGLASLYIAKAWTASAPWFVLAMPLTWLLLHASFATSHVFPLSHSFKLSLLSEWSQDTSIFTS